MKYFFLDFEIVNIVVLMEEGWDICGYRWFDLICFQRRNILQISYLKFMNDGCSFCGCFFLGIYYRNFLEILGELKKNIYFDVYLFVFKVYQMVRFRNFRNYICFVDLIILYVVFNRVGD